MMGFPLNHFYGNPIENIIRNPIENILCKINNDSYTKFVLELFFPNTTESIKLKSLNCEKMLFLANQYHNQSIIDFIHDNLINNDK